MSAAVPAQAAAAAERPVSLTTDELSALIKPLLLQAVQAHTTGADGSTAAPAEADADALLAGLKQYLNLHVLSSRGVQGVVALPDVDEALLPLQQEVEAVMQSVAGHRASVPAVITKALEQQLQQMRPAADAAPAADQEAAPAAPGAGEVDVARERELHEALQAALNKLPALRARLEEMDVRLQRNLAVVDASQSTAGRSPRTVERVLRSVAAGQCQGRGAAAGAGPGAAAAATPAAAGGVGAHDEEEVDDLTAGL